MSVKIRLRRTGATKQPSYRMVVADSTSPRDGSFIEILGHYNPLAKPPIVNIDVDRAKYWLGHGAQPTDAAVRLLRKAGMDIAAPSHKGEAKETASIQEEKRAEEE